MIKLSAICADDNSTTTETTLTTATETSQSPTETTTQSLISTTSSDNDNAGNGFDIGSFFGGIALGGGLAVISIVGYHFYKKHNEKTYIHVA